MAPNKAQREELDHYSWEEGLLSRDADIAWQKHYVVKVGHDLASAHWHLADRDTGHRQGFRVMMTMFYTLKSEKQAARRRQEVYAREYMAKMSEYGDWDRLDEFRKELQSRARARQDAKAEARQQAMQARMLVQQARGG
ncbi:hypothetical protein HYH03_013529 [Edaphochlamys debaryana]|uniref:Uncharacterized protein n=1 Tax=Edaphochlamys debaryana TaxID=47281 RepID=A0A835XQU0_9CHLO|nr:hypothetical protein HYH03_013529 [Edaphochlamys debaryana]|eukprot:KAG2487950.1 hypothetical protein HYH03_013529 [Edaphochlamys debaryana]